MDDVDFTKFLKVCEDTIDTFVATGDKFDIKSIVNNDIDLMNHILDMLKMNLTVNKIEFSKPLDVRDAYLRIVSFFLDKFSSLTKRLVSTNPNPIKGSGTLSGINYWLARFKGFTFWVFLVSLITIALHHFILISNNFVEGFEKTNSLISNSTALIEQNFLNWTGMMNYSSAEPFETSEPLIAFSDISTMGVYPSKEYFRQTCEVRSGLRFPSTFVMVDELQTRYPLPDETDLLDGITKEDFVFKGVGVLSADAFRGLKQKQTLDLKETKAALKFNDEDEGFELEVLEDIQGKLAEENTPSERRLGLLCHLHLRTYVWFSSDHVYKFASALERLRANFLVSKITQLNRPLYLQTYNQVRNATFSENVSTMLESAKNFTLADSFMYGVNYFSTPAPSTLIEGISKRNLKIVLFDNFNRDYLSFSQSTVYDAYVVEPMQSMFLRFVKESGMPNDLLGLEQNIIDNDKIDPEIALAWLCYDGVPPVNGTVIPLRRECVRVLNTATGTFEYWRSSSHTDAYKLLNELMHDSWQQFYSPFTGTLQNKGVATKNIMLNYGVMNVLSYSLSVAIKTFIAKTPSNAFISISGVLINRTVAGGVAAFIGLYGLVDLISIQLLFDFLMQTMRGGLLRSRQDRIEAWSNWFAMLVTALSGPRLGVIIMGYFLTVLTRMQMGVVQFVDVEMIKSLWRVPRNITLGGLNRAVALINNFPSRDQICRVFYIKKLSELMNVVFFSRKRRDPSTLPTSTTTIPPTVISGSVSNAGNPKFNRGQVSHIDLKVGPEKDDEEDILNVYRKNVFFKTLEEKYFSKNESVACHVFLNEISSEVEEVWIADKKILTYVYF